MKDFIVSLAFLSVSVFALITSEIFSRKGKNAYSLAFNPAMYPRIIAAILLVLSCVLMFQSIRKGALKNVKVHIDRKKTIKLVKLFLIIVMYIAGIYFIGYIISTVICVFLLVLIFDGKIVQAILCAVAATICLYLVFHIGFRIQLPAGYFFE